MLKHAAAQIHKRAQISGQIKQFYPKTGCDLREGVHAISCPAGTLRWRVLCDHVRCVASVVFPPKHRASLSHGVKG